MSRNGASELEVLIGTNQEWHKCFLILQDMAPRKKYNIRKGAVVSALSNRLHPSKHIQDKYKNPQKGHRLGGLKVLRREEKKIRKKDVLCVVMTHNDFVCEEERNPLEL